MIYNDPAIEFVPDYHEQLYDQEEELLDRFSQNFDFHTDSYNQDFNNIIYYNVCQYIDYGDTEACESFNQNILQSGIYSTVIKYWDFLRQMNHDYMESSRSVQELKYFLNGPRMKNAELMQDFYFKIALDRLVSRLEADIDYFFDIEYIQNRTIFIFYLLYIVFIYVFIWLKFVSLMQDDMWKTKSMLSVLPT